MRSRFSAFARNDEAYLLRTWSARTRPRTLDLDAGTRWTRLEITATADGSLLDREGMVRFEAHYRHEGKAGVLREESRFAREQGQWVYVSGVHSGQ